MQNLRQTSRFERFSVGMSALLVMMLLFSCSKNITDSPSEPATTSAAVNASAPSSERNGNTAVPFENTLFVPCANGGAGENVALTGKTSFVYEMAWTDHGFTMIYHDNSHEVTGVGLSSGETFTGSGGTEGVVMGSWVNNQWMGDMVRQMRIIGENTVFRVNYKLHLIVTPDGNVVVNIREQTVDCQ